MKIPGIPRLLTINVFPAIWQALPADVKQGGIPSGYPMKAVKSIGLAVSECHSESGPLNTLIEETQIEIADLLNTLGTKLNELGILMTN